MLKNPVNPPALTLSFEDVPVPAPAPAPAYTSSSGTTTVSSFSSKVQVDKADLSFRIPDGVNMSSWVPDLDSSSDFDSDSDSDSDSDFDSDSVSDSDSPPPAAIVFLASSNFAPRKKPLVPLSCFGR